MNCKGKMTTYMCGLGDTADCERVLRPVSLLNQKGVAIHLEGHGDYMATHIAMGFPSTARSAL